MPVPTKPLIADTNWLTADLNWPRLAQIFPALAEFDFAKIQMQVVGRGGNLQLTGQLALAQPLPALEKWRLPTNAIYQPLVSFTAVRGAGPWLAKQPWMRPFEIQPPPGRLFIWAMARIPLRLSPPSRCRTPRPRSPNSTSGCPPTAACRGNSWFGTLAMTNNEISLRGLPPLVTPFVQALHEPAGDFLVAGFFPNPSKAPPPPPELLAALNQPNLVYYHWEDTAGRLKELPPQITQLLLALTRREQLKKLESAAGKWFDRIEPALGSTVTEVTQIAPNELAFKRTAPGGLTAIELLALVDWLEAPKFPALDLRVPPPPARSGQKPFNLLSTPPPVPAPAHP